MSANEAKFEQHVDRSGDCWKWTGTRNSDGYGVLRLGKKMVKAHRMSYELTSGSIPAGLVIDHICINRLCVKPSHLRAVTSKQNSENRSGASKRNVGSGVLGVHKTPGGRFQARANHNGQAYTAGTHATIAEAEAAVIALRLSLYTHNEVDRANLPRTA